MIHLNTLGTILGIISGTSAILYAVYHYVHSKGRTEALGNKKIKDLEYDLNAIKKDLIDISQKMQNIEVYLERAKEKIENSKSRTDALFKMVDKTATKIDDFIKIVLEKND